MRPLGFETGNEVSTSISALRDDFFARLATPAYMESLLDPVDDVVFALKTRDGVYLSVNEAWVKRCGLKHKSQALGRTASDLFPTQMAARYEAQDKKLLANGMPIVNSLDLIVLADGSAGWCLSNKVPLLDQKKKIIGIATFSKDLVEPSRGGLIDAAFAEMIDYVQANYSEALRVEQLAKRAGLNTSQFERRMKRIFHISAAQFISKTRIDAALLQLTQTDHPAGQIAVDCGWYDHAAFSRQFKQVTGLTPSEFRLLSRR